VGVGVGVLVTPPSPQADSDKPMLAKTAIARILRPAIKPLSPICT
jgi:hypothetical protein